ncbi:hypothetical protein NY751_21920, partial [Xanthomonas campestris]|nr:hypothetical protein [Xanthomonas campestris]
KAPEMAKNPKIQTRLSGTMQHSALSNRIVQTFLEQLIKRSEQLFAVGAEGLECKGYMAIPSSGRARLAAVQSF